MLNAVGRSPDDCVHVARLQARTVSSEALNICSRTSSIRYGGELLTSCPPGRADQTSFEVRRRGAGGWGAGLGDDGLEVVMGREVDGVTIVRRRLENC